MSSRQVLALVVASAMLAALPSPATLDLPGLAGPAWADDDGDDDGGGADDGGDDGGDDDGGDDDGGDDDDDGARADAPGADRQGGDRQGGDRAGGGGGGFLRDLFAPRRTPPAVAAPAPRAVAAAAEIVAPGLTEADLGTLLAQGFSVIEEVAAPGGVLRRLQVPPGVSLAEARTAVRALPSGADADLNHFFRSEQGFPEDCAGDLCPARRAIGWPDQADRAGACGRTVTIGMIDTGINDGHETFSGARLAVRRQTPSGLDPSRAVHGTAVAALLVGDPATRSPGLVPGAPLVAIDAFHRAGTDERADAFTLIAALSDLAAAGAHVINLSLSGPENAALAALLDDLTGPGDIVVVAAAGNGGPAAPPAYPAAHPGVIAVTAVDRQGNPYRRAARGGHVDIAAPGVAVWTAASIRGARTKTGTSFAAPFVTAAAAILREASPELTAAEVAEELRRRATDLGPPGPDETFGAGLLNLGTVCADAT